MVCLSTLRFLGRSTAAVSLWSLPAQQRFLSSSRTDEPGRHGVRRSIHMHERDRPGRKMVERRILLDWLILRDEHGFFGGCSPSRSHAADDRRLGYATPVYLTACPRACEEERINMKEGPHPCWKQWQTHLPLLGDAHRNGERRHRPHLAPAQIVCVCRSLFLFTRSSLPQSI